MPMIFFEETSKGMAFLSLNKESLLYGKIDFTKVKILLDTVLKIILLDHLDHQNNYENNRTLKLMARMSKLFAALCSSVLHNYFDSLNYFQIYIYN